LKPARLSYTSSGEKEGRRAFGEAPDLIMGLGKNIDRG
jgi:hypothetical protein